MSYSLYRLKFANTIFQAQQLVSHGHIQVNGRKVDRRSFQVKPGMVISLKEKSRKSKNVHLALESATRSVPEYLSHDQENFKGQLLSLPSMDAITLPLEINIPMVCDFLAHGQ